MAGDRVEPAAAMREAAHQMREMYVALVNEGFTPKEALTMLGQTLAAGITAQIQHGEDK